MKYLDREKKIKYAICDCCGKKIYIKDKYYIVKKVEYSSFEPSEEFYYDICENCIDNFILKKIETMYSNDNISIEKEVLYNLYVDFIEYKEYKIIED